MIWTLIVGLIVGAIAKMLMPGKDPGGFIVTMILGVLGSMLAHFIGARAGWYETGEPAGIISSVIGAVVLLAIYRAVTNNKHRTIGHH
ncbi:MAG: GlsB/YeaQ/YmgE family stress response membrane protein [Bdellovibrionales bacterium]|nr:GlsB/YeaQ/YmgE family stress response membrane protein [Bdellovibrionales bacterium]